VWDEAAVGTPLRVFGWVSPGLEWAGVGESRRFSGVGLWGGAGLP